MAESYSTNSLKETLGEYSEYIKAHAINFAEQAPAAAQIAVSAYKTIVTTGSAMKVLDFKQLAENRDNLLRIQNNLNKMHNSVEEVNKELEELRRSRRVILSDEQIQEILKTEWLLSEEIDIVDAQKSIEEEIRRLEALLEKQETEYGAINSDDDTLNDFDEEINQSSNVLGTYESRLQPLYNATSYLGSAAYSAGAIGLRVASSTFDIVKEMLPIANDALAANNNLVQCVKIIREGLEPIFETNDHVELDIENATQETPTSNSTIDSIIQPSLLRSTSRENQ